MTIDSLTLLPCPFCGGPASVQKSTSTDWYGNWVAGCDNYDTCHAQPSVLGSDKPEGREQAVKQWNLRQQAPRVHPMSETESAMIEAMAREVVECAGGAYGTIYAALSDAYQCGLLGISYEELKVRQAADRERWKGVEVLF